MGEWWIIVTKVLTVPQCFIMKPEEVRRLAHHGEIDGRVSYWLQPKQYDADEFREAWDRIGRGDVGGQRISAIHLQSASLSPTAILKGCVSLIG